MTTAPASETSTRSIEPRTTASPIVDLEAALGGDRAVAARLEVLQVLGERLRELPHLALLPLLEPRRLERELAPARLDGRPQVVRRRWSRPVSIAECTIVPTFAAMPGSVRATDSRNQSSADFSSFSMLDGRHRRRLALEQRLASSRSAAGRATAPGRRRARPRRRALRGWMPRTPIPRRHRRFREDPPQPPGHPAQRERRRRARVDGPRQCRHELEERTRPPRRRWRPRRPRAGVRARETASANIRSSSSSTTRRSSIEPESMPSTTRTSSCGASSEPRSRRFGHTPSCSPATTTVSNSRPTIAGGRGDEHRVIDSTAARACPRAPRRRAARRGTPPADRWAGARRTASRP